MRVPLVDLPRLLGPLREKIDEAIATVLDHNAYVTGFDVEAFEDEFAAFCGVEYAVGVASGTHALMLALRGLGVGRGDEVITVPNSFISAGEAITMVGAAIRFVDVDPLTQTMDPGQLAAVISPKTRAIIPAHLHGHPCDMTSLTDVARKHSLFMIEDATDAHGARWHGRLVGSFGDYGCFSFAPHRNLGGIGEAGAVVTNDRALAERVKQLRNHGRASDAKHEHAIEGLNARMDAIHAAVLRVKLPHLREWNATRARTALRYSELLRDSENCVVPMPHERAAHVFHRYVMQTPWRDAFRKSMQAQDIETGVHYPVPLHLQPAYAYLGLGKGSFPIAEALAANIVSLPMFPYMTEPEIAHVTKAVRTFVRSSVHA